METLEGAGMEKDIGTALRLAASIAALVVAFIVLIRVIVPAILEAHFAGSVITATVVGIGGVLALVWVAWKLWSWSIRR